MLLTFKLFDNKHNKHSFGINIKCNYEKINLANCNKKESRFPY